MARCRCLVADSPACRRSIIRYDDHHVRLDCVDAFEVTIVTWLSLRTVRASSIAAIDQLLARALEPVRAHGTDAVAETPRGVFVSPDGQSIGFFDGLHRSRQCAITGGPAMTICVVRREQPRGATWGADGTIVYATNGSQPACSACRRVGASLSVLTNADRGRRERSPGGPSSCLEARRSSSRSLRVQRRIDNAQIAVLDLQTGTSKVLVRGGSHAQLRADRSSGLRCRGDVARRGLRP